MMIFEPIFSIVMNNICEIKEARKHGVLLLFTYSSLLISEWIIRPFPKFQSYSVEKVDKVG